MLQLAEVVRVLLQTNQTPTIPTPKPEEIEGPLFTATSALYLTLAVLTLVLAIIKILYGSVLKGTGAPGVSARGATEVMEGFLSLFWFLVAVVLLPWVIKFLADAQVIPGWIGKKVIEACLKIIWQQG